MSLSVYLYPLSASSRNTSEEVFVLVDRRGRCVKLVYLFVRAIGFCRAFCTAKVPQANALILVVNAVYQRERLMYAMSEDDKKMVVIKLVLRAGLFLPRIDGIKAMPNTRLLTESRMSCQWRINLMIANKKTLLAKCLCLAGPTGFEPAISSVTGRRDRPTSLRALVLPYAVSSFCLAAKASDCSFGRPLRLKWPF